MDVTILPQALEEIADIHNYISQNLANPSAANKLVSQIEKRLDLLAVFPYSGTPIIDEPVASKGFRKLIVDNHFVIYSVIESEQIVRVHHVLYAKSDYLSYL